MLEVKLIKNDENVNKEKTSYFINLLKENSGNIDTNILQSIFYSFNNENVENISSKKFLTSNLFLINNSIIPKIWTFLFSFDDDSDVLNYIISNLLPFEREIYYIVKLNFYSKLNDKSDIEKCLEFTEKLNFFYNEESFLWRDLIGKKLDENLRDEEYKNYLDKIEEEKSKLDILKDFSWPEKSIFDLKLILEEQSKEIYNKIETEQMSLELQKAKDKLLNLKSKILKLNLKGGLQIFRIGIIEKIDNLSKDKLEIILEKTKEIQQEIEDLISTSKEEVVSISGNDLDWGNPILKYKLTENLKTIKLYKNMLFYSVCNELERKIMDSKDNKERYRYGKEIGKLGLEFLLRFINSFGNEAFGADNRKAIKSMIRAQLMLKLWNDEIDQINVKYFIQELNNKISRNSISKEEYGFTYQIASKYSLTTKIIQPNFEPKDIIYLFFKYNENNEYSAGPIFENISIQSMKMNNIFKEALEEIKQNKLTNMCDICMVPAKIIYREFFNAYDMKLADNFDDLIIFFIEEKKKFEQGNEEKILSAIINAMKLSKFFNDIIKTNEKIKENKVSFNDMAIFDKKNNKRIDIESLLLKQMNPSFKFFIIKNLQLIKSLINSKLNDEDITKLLSPQEGEIYIPFWVFLIRNMSSINCINYENKNNPFCDEISEEVRQKIEDIIKSEKGEELDNCWLNLILENIPNEVKITNIRLFYLFFNNLFEKLNANKLLKEKIQDILKNYYFDLINYALDGRIHEILKNDIEKSDNSILKLIDSPKKHIKELILNEYRIKAKNMVINKFQDLDNILDKLINEIPEYLKRIKDNVTNVEKIYNEEQEKVEIENKIKEIENKLNEYNNCCDNLLLKEENEFKYGNQIHPQYIDKLQKNKYEILIYKDLLIEKEKIKYWIIPFKYQKNTNIYYEDNEDNEDNDKNDNNKYKLDKGDSNNSTLYFKNKIDDKNMKNFSIYTKKGEKRELKDYIFFEQAKDEEISKYSFNVNDESKNKIKEKFIYIQPKKVNFKGRSFDEISIEINDLKSILVEIKNNLSYLKQGKFENLNLKIIKEKYKKISDDLKIHFDIKKNEINESIDFTQITEIKAKLEEYLISIQNEFDSLCNESDIIFGNITEKFIKDLDKIFINNFNMPLLPDEKPHYINYDNLDINSSLLSMPMISKKDGILKCNYNKISFQKGIQNYIQNLLY